MLSREASVGMLFTKATQCEKSLEADELAIRRLYFSYNRVKGILMERAEFYARIQVAPNDPVTWADSAA